MQTNVGSMKISMAKFYIYSKSGCGFCDKLGSFMDNRDLPYEKLLLGKDFSVEEFLNKFGRGSTFPQVNYKNQNIGGMKDTVRYIQDQKIL